MPDTDIRKLTEIWVTLRRDEVDDASDRAEDALVTLSQLQARLEELAVEDNHVQEALDHLRKLRETDSGYSRYHIQGIATSKEIAISMCRDETYLVGPLPVNVALPHTRTDWPGLYFPLKEGG